MADKKFDPNKFIDRKFELDLFKELLQFKDDTRILAIKDDGGMGKTQLLQRLHHHCRDPKSRTPVSLVALDQLPDSHPLTLIQTIVQDLSVPVFGLDFPNFIKFNLARVAGDFAPILSSVYLQGANFQGASNIRTAGAMANVEGAQTVNLNLTSTGVGTLTGQQQDAALKVCVRAFFDDLKNHCQDTPVVILLDAYEKCADSLKEWILNYFLQEQFFDLAHRPKRLVLVVAGREVPPFEENWTPEDIETVVGSVRQLGKWEKEHVEECLQKHGINYEPKQVDIFYGLIEMGYPPSYVVQLIETAPKFGRGAP